MATATNEVLFVLRGRPGLGHVMPGLAIARGFVSRGHKVTVMTYGNGQAFLDRSDDWGMEVVNCLDVSEEYRDWPGLDLYDHGVRRIGPYLETRRPSLCIFGGEYVMAPIAAAVGCPNAMMFNPEIMEDNPRNDLPSRLFCKIFESCTHLIPLAPLSSDRPYLSEFEALRSRVTPYGPFCVNKSRSSPKNNAHRTVLIANGGGVNFPKATTSYSTDETSPALWLEETREMTVTALRAALENLRDGDRVYVFSCLGAEFNSWLAREFTEGRLEVHAPSSRYYDVLAEADLVVSRGGTGFIADAQTTDSSVVLWGLTGHDEQRQNALELVKSRPATQFCNGPEDLYKAVKLALQRAGSPGERPHILRHSENVERLLDYLEAAT